MSSCLGGNKIQGIITLFRFRCYLSEVILKIQLYVHERGAAKYKINLRYFHYICKV